MKICPYAASCIDAIFQQIYVKFFFWQKHCLILQDLLFVCPYFFFELLLVLSSFKICSAFKIVDLYSIITWIFMYSNNVTHTLSWLKSTPPFYSNWPINIIDYQQPLSWRQIFPCQYIHVYYIHLYSIVKQD